MLVVLFEANDQTYALPAGEVIEVLPSLALRDVPASPAWLAGLACVRAAVVPVVDLSARLGGRPARAALSTRIALVRRAGREGAAVGLLAEKMTGTARVEQVGALRSLAVPDAPFLGDVVLDDGRMIQLVRPQHLLLSADIEALLFEEGGRC